MISLYSAIVFIAAVSAVPLGRRDVTTVLSNLQNIDTQTKALTNSINGWNGSLLGALGIASASNNLGTALGNANTEAETEVQESTADTQTILAFISGTLTTDTVAALSALSEREADVAAIGLDALVLGQIQSLQQKIDALGASLVSISSADLQASAQSLVGGLDAAFANAIAVYS